MSRAYGYAQTAAFCVFAVAVIFNRGPLLFAWANARGVGSALCILGVMIMAAAFVSLRNVIQINPEPKAGGHLVTSGVYRRLRHPIYTAILLIVIGLWLRQPTILLCVASLVVSGFLVVKSRYEERLLAERYPEYAQYRAHTWGFIPGIRG